MRRVRRAGVVLLMARIAERAIERVVVVDVTIGALPRRHRVRPGERKSRAVVVERSVQPGGSAVALIASLRKIQGRVTWIRRSLVVLQVTGHAGRAAEVVIIVHVTVSALARRHSVHAGQREASAVVVKRRVQPGTGVVTLAAALREVRCDVVRIRGSLVVL